MALPVFQVAELRQGLAHNFLLVMWLDSSRAGPVTRPHNLREMLYIYIPPEKLPLLIMLNGKTLGLKHYFHAK